MYFDRNNELLPGLQNLQHVFRLWLIGKCDLGRIHGFCTRVWLVISESHSVILFRLGLTGLC